MIHRSFVVLFISVLSFASCKPVDVIRLIQTEKAEPVHLASESRQVLYVPMHHIGRPQFYDAVKKLVDSFKVQGFIVYYESAKMDAIDNAAAMDLYHRKFRKMMGVHIDSTGYAKYFHQTGLFRQLIDQPPYGQLGVDSADLRIDLSKNSLVDLYEKRFGEIELEKGDWIPLEDRYNIQLRLPQKEVMSLIIDERNRNLATAIQFLPHKKIIVLYGTAHLKGTLAELKKFDRTWNMKRGKRKGVPN